MEYLIFLLVFNITILFLYFLGLAYCQLLKKESTIFDKLFFGFFIFSTFISLFFTQLKSIQIVLLMALTFYVLNDIKNSKEPSKNKNIPQEKFSNILAGMLVINFFYVINSFRYFDIELNFGVPFCDIIFYANLSNSLIQSHLENINIYNITEKLNGCSPYHYTEFWFNGGLATMLNLNKVKVLVLVTYPILASIAFWGYKEIANHFGIKQFYGNLISFLLLFWTGINSNELLDKVWLIQNVNVYGFDPILMPKLLPIQICILKALSILLKERTNYLKALIILSFCPVINITTLPAILFLVSAFIFSEILIIKKVNFYYLLPLFVVLCVPLFYLIFGINHPSGLFIDFKLYKEVQFWKRFIGNVGSYFLKVFSINLLIVPLFFKFYYKFLNKNFIIISLSMLFPAVLAGLLEYVDDSLQLFTIYTVSVINILGSFLILKSFSVINWPKYYAIAVLGIHFIYRISRTEPITATQTDKDLILLLKNDLKSNMTIGIFKNLTNVDFNQKKEYLNYPGQIIATHIDGLQAINLSILDSDCKSKQDSSIISNSTLYRFKARNHIKSDEETIIEFIRSKKIKVLLLENVDVKVIPLEIKKDISTISTINNLKVVKLK